MQDTKISCYPINGSYVSARMDRHNNMFFLQNFNQEIIMSHLNDTFYQIFKYLEYDIENFFKIKG